MLNVAVVHRIAVVEAREDDTVGVLYNPWNVKSGIDGRQANEPRTDGIFEEAYKCIPDHRSFFDSPAFPPSCSCLSSNTDSTIYSTSTIFAATIAVIAEYVELPNHPERIENSQSVNVEVNAELSDEGKRAHHSRRICR